MSKNQSSKHIEEIRRELENSRFLDNVVFLGDGLSFTYEDITFNDKSEKVLNERKP